MPGKEIVDFHAARLTTKLTMDKPGVQQNRPSLRYRNACALLAANLL